MIGIKYVVFLVVLTFLWIPSSGDPEVFCVFMERCILPCSFQVAPQVVIHWTHMTKGDLLVHSFYDNQDHLGRQDQMFRNRTSLFQDQISRGNASLQLTGVKVQDEGRYKCYCSTTSGNKESFINLKVDAPIQTVDIQQVENRITCSSEGIYPEPELTWSTTPPSNINLHNTTHIIKNQNQQQLYSISSSLILSDNSTDLVYSCTVTNHRNKRTATLSRTGGSVAGIAAGVVLSIVVLAALVVFCIRRHQQNQENEKPNRREKNNPDAGDGEELNQLANGEDEAAQDPAAPEN